MSVQMDGQLRPGLQALDQRIRLVGQKQVRHVLYADDVRAHLLKLLGEVYEIILGMHGAEGVAHRGLTSAAVFLCSLNGSLHIARIVQRVEDADDIDAVFDGLLHEKIDHVVGVVLVAQNVLPAQEHLQLRVRQRLAQSAQTLPRIFV